MTEVERPPIVEEYQRSDVTHDSGGRVMSSICIIVLDSSVRRKLIGHRRGGSDRRLHPHPPSSPLPPSSPSSPPPATPPPPPAAAAEPTPTVVSVAITVISVAEPLVRRRGRRRCRRRGGGRGCGVRRRRLERSDPNWRPADAVDASGIGLLHSAIAQGRPDLVQLLLEFGADVEQPGRGPTTPLEASAAQEAAGSR
uniref:Uncharacterized protein n=1 Tax=Ananas comosus var. bracteatus TaxID=296719 RepID=A0A6V7PU01_ANACO|nr:unnamed protein product [Ananas comosus var. bracteatus]